MHGLELIQDLAVVMIVAGLVTVVCHRLRQPVVLGYIVAGAIIGPHTPPFPLINDEKSIETLAELGVILLMFSLGLHFSFRKLMRVGASALIAAVLEIMLMSVVGYLLGRAFGWSVMNSIFLGAILSISSTTIIVKALEDMGLSKKKFSQVIFGILVVEDILAIAMIALLSGIAARGTVAAGDVLVTLGTLVVFLASLLVVGLLTVPWLLRYLERFKSNEMFLVAALGLCFGVSLLAAKLGYSVALGAFMIGAIIAESREVGRISTLVEPVRDMFSAVFFVAVGMMIDPHLLVEYWVPIAVVTVAVVIGKVVSCSLGALIAGQDRSTALHVGMGLAQIGEFSFIIAQLGQDRGVTSGFLYPIAVSVSAITTLLTPYLIRGSDRTVNLLERISPNAVLGYLDAYHQWLNDLSANPSAAGQVRALLRKWGMQIAVNVALVSGILIAAKSVAFWAEKRGTMLPDWTGGPRAVTWLLAMIVAMPLLVATVRKMRAVANVLAEMRLASPVNREKALAIRNVLANSILFPAVIALGVWILGISAALLPPWPVFIALVIILATVAAVTWNRLVKIYASAQISLRDTLSQVHPEPAEQVPVPALLSMARTETVAIPASSPAAGKLIRELQLRTRTGASAVGIERNGQSVINPGPDEELQPGDRILLLGDERQLHAARQLLTAGALV